jgi:hypothetical protein
MRIIEAELNDHKNDNAIYRLRFYEGESEFIVKSYRSDAVFEIYEFKDWNWLRKNTAFDDISQNDPHKGGQLAWSYARLNPKFDDFFKTLSTYPKLYQHTQDSSYKMVNGYVSYGLEIVFEKKSDMMLFKLTFC